MEEDEYDPLAHGKRISNFDIPTHIKAIAPQPLPKSTLSSFSSSSSSSLKRRWQPLIRRVRTNLTVDNQNVQNNMNDGTQDDKTRTKQSASADHVELSDAERVAMTVALGLAKINNNDNNDNDNNDTNNDNDDNAIPRLVSPQLDGGAAETPARKRLPRQVATPKNTRLQALKNDQSNDDSIITPGGVRRGMLLTPKLVDKDNAVLCNDDTPLKGKDGVMKGKATPRSKKILDRHILANAIQRTQDDASDTDSDQFVEDDDDSEKDSDDEDLDDIEKVAKRSHATYFDAVHEKPSKTSDNTLSQLPFMTYQEFIQKIAQAPVKHEKERKVIDALYHSQFPQWHVELNAGFNLIFYGYGSKRTLLHDFATYLHDYGRVMTINGYMPVNMRDVCQKILSDVWNEDIGTGTVHDLAIQIAETDASDKEPLFMLFNSIDMVRQEKTIAALSIIAAHPRIHFFCSADHINFPTIFSTMVWTRFRFLMHDVSYCYSENDYLVETAEEIRRLLKDTTVEEGGQVTAKSAVRVLNVLTKNARAVFCLLAEYMLKCSEENMDVDDNDSDDDRKTQKKGKVQVHGVEYYDYFQMCRAKFLATSDVTFRQLLTELLDHQIIQVRRTADGDMYYVPMSSNDIEQTLEECRQ